MCHSMYGRLESNVLELVLSFHRVSPGEWAHAIGLNNLLKCVLPDMVAYISYWKSGELLESCRIFPEALNLNSENI